MKQERKQYPVPAMLGLLSTVGGACWAGVCLCLRSLHFPAAHWGFAGIAGAGPVGAGGTDGAGLYQCVPQCPV